MSIVVGMRLRPLVGHEAGQKPVFRVANNQINIIQQNLAKEDQEAVANEGPWSFDHVMDSSDHADPNYVDNDKCYQHMGRPLVESVLQGYNACLFCYGQTGTGKTATLMGYDTLGPGLLPRMLTDMCKEADSMRAEGYTVNLSCQMLEVYNETIHDLLEDRAKWAKMTVKTRVMPQGVMVTGATERPVNTVDECIKIMDEGAARKTIAKTKMNPTSSRGHTVFKLVIDKSGGPDGRKMHCEVYFADLAGHENVKTTEVTGAQMVELTHINTSLMYLQRAISELAKGSAAKKPVKSMAAGAPKVNMSPFRNSELTLLMANGIVGNSRSTVIVTLSPAAAHFDTSHSSIEFGLEVKGIKLEVTAIMNVDPKVMVSNLQAEVTKLKVQLAEMSKANVSRPLAVSDAAGAAGADSEKLAGLMSENAKLLIQLSQARQELKLQAARPSADADALVGMTAKVTESEKKLASLSTEKEHLLSEVQELRVEVTMAKSKAKKKKGDKSGEAGEDGETGEASDPNVPPAAAGESVVGLASAGESAVSGLGSLADPPEEGDKGKKKKRKSVAVVVESVRDGMINELLQLLDATKGADTGHDIAGDGRLGPYQLRPFANFCGFEGTEQDWNSEFALLCQTYGDEGDTSIKFDSFRDLVNEEGGRGYCTDRELLGMIAVLKRTSVEDREHVLALGNMENGGFRPPPQEGPIKKPPVKQVSFIPPTDLPGWTQIDELNATIADLGTMLERLQKDLRRTKEELKEAREAQAAGGGGCCRKRKPPPPAPAPAKIVN